MLLGVLGAFSLTVPGASGPATQADSADPAVAAAVAAPMAAAAGPATPPSAAATEAIGEATGHPGTITDSAGAATTPGRNDRRAPARALADGVESVSGYWRSDLAGVPIGSAGCGYASGTPTAAALKEQWNYWDNCGASVVSVSAEGLPPTPWNGDRVVKWYKAAGDRNVQQKLNRAFSRDNFPSAVGVTQPIGSPADASGRYIVYQYIPSSRFRLNPAHGWVLLSEFKEDYLDANGNWRQDPTWGLGCHNFAGSGRVLCSLNEHQTPTLPFSDVVDRWVKWEFRLFQGARDTSGRGGRIELYMDDRLIDTGYQSEKPVGTAAFSPLNRTRDWVWIAGQYTSNQVTNGVPDYQNTDVTSYVGLSAVLPLP